MNSKAGGGLSTASRVLIPALMFQAVAIGGAYATGREIIEFGAAYGALGWAAGAAMAAVGALLAFLVYETARRHGLFDYRAMTRHLIGRAYWLFDAIYIPFALAILAVLTSATGNILEDTLGVPYWGGVLIIVVIAAWVIFQGTEVMERFNGIGTIALMAGYVLFAMLVITARWDHIVAVFSSGDHALEPAAGIGDAVILGAVYVGLGFVIYPSTLITVRHLRSRREAAVSALLTGGLYVVPWFLTYIALMGYYPQARVFDAPVPWLTMLGDADRWVVVLYGVLVGWTLVATAVGLIQSVLVRIDLNLAELQRPAIGASVRTAVVFAALGTGALLSAIGIVDLIAIGYLVGAVALIVVFGIPLFLRSATYLWRGSAEGAAPALGSGGGGAEPRKP